MSDIIALCIFFILCSGTAFQFSLGYLGAALALVASLLFGIMLAKYLAGENG